MTFLLILLLSVYIVTSYFISDSDSTSSIKGFLLPITGLLGSIVLFILILLLISNHTQLPVLITEYQEDSKYITTHLTSDDGHERVKSAELALNWNKKINEYTIMKDNIWVGCMYADTIAGLNKFDLSKFKVDSLVVTNKKGN